MTSSPSGDPARQSPHPFSLARIDEAIGIVCLVAIVAVILWGVLSRYVFPQPAAWTYEVAVIAFTYLVFFGAAAGVRLRSHAAIDIVTALLPERFQAAVDWFNYLLVGALFGLMGVLFAWQAVIGHAAHTPALDLPRSIVYAPLALACLGMLAQHLVVERPWVRPARTQHTESVI